MITNAATTAALNGTPSLAPSADAGQGDATPPVVLARDLRGADDIEAALRARVLELAHGSDDHKTNLIAPIPLKSFRRTTLGSMLTALGCYLLLVEDEDLVQRITSRIERNPHRNGHASETMLAMRRKQRRGKRWRGNSEFGRLMNAQRQLALSPRKRKAIARTAARARWGKPRDAPKKQSLSTGAA